MIEPEKSTILFHINTISKLIIPHPVDIIRILTEQKRDNEGITNRVPFGGAKERRKEKFFFRRKRSIDPSLYLNRKRTYILSIIVFLLRIEPRLETCINTFDSWKKRRMCGHFTSVGIRIIHPRSPSPLRGDRQRKRERLIVKATTINKYIVRPTAAWLEMAIPNGEIGCRWCIRNLQTLVSRAHARTTHTHVSHLTCAEMREEERKGCGRGSVPLGHW